VAIRDVSQGSISTSDQIPFYDVTAGCDRRDSVSNLLALAATSGATPVRQYISPNATGTAVAVASIAAGKELWLIVTPIAAYAALTLNLPLGVDGVELVVNCTQAVTTLAVVGTTVGVTPQPVNGAPTTLAANAFFRLRFDGVIGAWYRVG
jgi:hypothetical protein